MSKAKSLTARHMQYGTGNARKTMIYKTRYGNKTTFCSTPNDKVYSKLYIETVIINICMTYNFHYAIVVLHIENMLILCSHTYPVNSFPV